MPVFILIFKLFRKEVLVLSEMKRGSWGGSSLHFARIMEMAGNEIEVELELGKRGKSHYHYLLHKLFHWS